MILDIKSTITIEDLQNSFHQKFKGLKIEFYNNPHNVNEGSSLTEQYDGQIKLEKLLAGDQENEIEILPSNTVFEIEDKFKKQLGLNAQIFRRSKDVWLQTSTTDQWTIEVQNQKGINSTK